MLPQHPRLPRCHVPQATALGLEPPLEVRSAGNEESLQEIAPIEVESLSELLSVDRSPEGSHVTRDPIDVEADLLVAPARDGARAQRIADHVQRLAQRGAGVLLVELRPKQRQQAVTAVEAWGGRGGEGGGGGKAARVAQQGPHVAPLGAGEAQPPPQTEAHPSKA